MEDDQRQAIILILGGIIFFIILGIIVYYGNKNYTSSTPQLMTKATTDNILTITNEFDFPIWVEAKYGNFGTPVPIGDTLYINNSLLDEYAATQEDKDYWKQAATTVELPPNSSVNYYIDEGGIAGARFWAKFSCNACGPSGDYATVPSLCLPPYPVGCANGSTTCSYKGEGTNCIIGDSSQYYIPPTATSSGGSIGGCPIGNCTPAVDSLFEATFGCSLTDQSQCNPNPSSSTGQLLGPTTFFDTSQVDGYTFPYVVLVTQTSTDALNSCINSNSGSIMPITQIQQNGQTINAGYIDASGTISQTSGLIMDYSIGPSGPIGCPINTNLSIGSGITTVTDSTLPVTYDTTNVDLGLYVDKTTKSINFPFISGSGTTTDPFTPGITPPPNSAKIACMSSCKRLNNGQPFGMNQSDGCNPTFLYCCPTTLPPGCTDVTQPQCCSNQQSPNCTSSTVNSGETQGCITSSACNSGPVATSDYVESVHNMAPGIYAFSYDDKQGLYNCGSGVKYQVIFGPKNSSASSYWNDLWSDINNS